MNLLRRSKLLIKPLRSFDKYLLLTYSTVLEDIKNRQREDRLQTRLLNFLESSKEINKNENAITVQNDFLQKNLDEASLEYKALYKLIETHMQPNQYSNTKISLNLIDNNCCKILRKLDHSKILQLLDLLTRAQPCSVTYLKFYKHSLIALRKMLESHSLSTQETLQLLFFEGLRKKLASGNVKFIINFLPSMNDLSIMEQCIVAHVAFKCGVKLKDVKLLEDVIEANAEMLVKDPAILTTFCKALRHAGPLPDCWLENLSTAIVNHSQRFTMKNVAHTLSLYAEAKLECSDVLQRLFDDSMKALLEERVQRQKCAIPLEKDVDRLLWASSILNYKLRPSDMLEISSFIDRRYENLLKKPFLFANTLLSLWILNYRLKEVMEKCLAEKVFQCIVEEKKLWKPVARFQLLLNCVRIEAPEIELPDEIIIPYKVGMKIHATVKKLSRIIDKLVEKLAIDQVTIDCPVSGIYIPGVSFRLRSEKFFHVDLLDEMTCIKATTVPHGLMNLKLRLLSKIGFNSILITEVQMNDAEAVSSNIERCIENIIQ